MLLDPTRAGLIAGADARHGICSEGPAHRAVERASGRPRACRHRASSSGVRDRRDPAQMAPWRRGQPVAARAGARRAGSAAVPGRKQRHRGLHRAGRLDCPAPEPAPGQALRSDRILASAPRRHEGARGEPVRGGRSGPERLPPEGLLDAAHIPSFRAGQKTVLMILPAAIPGPLSLRALLAAPPIVHRLANLPRKRTPQVRYPLRNLF